MTMAASDEWNATKNTTILLCHDSFPFFFPSELSSQINNHKENNDSKYLSNTCLN